MLWFFFLYMDSGDQTQVARLAQQVPSPTEPYVGPLPYILRQELSESVAFHFGQQAFKFLLSPTPQGSPLGYRCSPSTVPVSHVGSGVQSWVFRLWQQALRQFSHLSSTIFKLKYSLLM